MQFKGCGTALITPFHPDGSIDEPAFRALVRRQIDAGVHFLVPCGTTGESPTLEHKEHLRVVAMTLEEAKGKCPVLAGAGGYNTAEVALLAKELEAMGAGGILSVAPYYNKPTQEGLYQHYKTIAAAIRIPVVLYNVPGRTGVNIEPATVARLAAVKNIVGVKEATGNIAQMANLLAVVPDSFTVLSGDDGVTLPLASLGGKGVISVASNEIPAEMAALCNHILAGRWDDARRLHTRLLALMEINFVESNPIPVKYALSRMGLCQPVWRLPMCPPQPASAAKIDAVLRAMGLLKEAAHAG